MPLKSLKLIHFLKKLKCFVRPAPGRVTRLGPLSSCAELTGPLDAPGPGPAPPFPGRAVNLHQFQANYRYQPSPPPASAMASATASASPGRAALTARDSQWGGGGPWLEGGQAGELATGTRSGCVTDHLTDGETKARRRWA